MGKVIKTIVDYSDEILEEARRLTIETRDYKKAFRIALEMYVGYCSGQTNNNHTENINNIIAPGENIDNGQIYADETGQVKRDLI